MKKARISYTIQVVLNILCVIIFSIVAVKNYMLGKTGSMILNIICVVCWILCTICNSIQLAIIIKKETKEEQK